MTHRALSRTTLYSFHLSSSATRRRFSGTVISTEDNTLFQHLGGLGTFTHANFSCSFFHQFYQRLYFIDYPVCRKLAMSKREDGRWSAWIKCWRTTIGDGTASSRAACSRNLYKKPTMPTGCPWARRGPFISTFFSSFFQIYFSKANLWKAEEKNSEPA